MKTPISFRLWLRRGAWGLAAGLASAGCQRQPATQATASCIDPAKVNPSGICTMEYDPVCGCDGKTYSNACVATNAGVRTFTRGACAGQ